VCQGSQDRPNSVGQITRAFKYRDKSVFLQLYKQYVRPHLEFAVQAWSPCHQADKEVLEKVQRRAVGMVAGLRSREYEDRLKELGLTTLEERRHQADMLQMYKIINRAGDLDIADWFRPPTAAAARGRTKRAAESLPAGDTEELFLCACRSALELCTSGQ
jgi:hypothetical protein